MKDQDPVLRSRIRIKEVNQAKGSMIRTRIRGSGSSVRMKGQDEGSG